MTAARLKFRLTESGYKTLGLFDTVDEAKAAAPAACQWTESTDGEWRGWESGDIWDYARFRITALSGRD